MKKWFLSLAFLFSLLNHAEVLKYDITGYDRTLHSYKEVCQKMGHKELLLIEVTDALHLDCMGSKVSIKDFCLQNTDKDKGSLLRGFVNQKLQEVTCQYGESAYVSIACDKRDKYLCQKPKESCERLSNVYALSHNLFEYSFIEKDVDDILNCVYQRKEIPGIEKVTTKILLPFQEKPIIDKDIFAHEKVKNRSR